MNKYDLIINVEWGHHYKKKSVLAWAATIVRHPKSQRPIWGLIGVEDYGNDLWNKSQDFEMNFQGAVSTMIHELGHIIAFDEWKTFQKNHLTTVGKGNKTKYYWKGPKVEEVAKKYYDCKHDFIGLPLQSKSSGELGHHWEQAWFGPEGMTPYKGVEPHLFSAMTLALCDDSDWY
jgi:hypothetical protein